MGTVGLDYYLFGYRSVSAEAGSEAKLASALIYLGIGSRRDSDGSFRVREGDFARLRAYLGGRVRFGFSELKGLPGGILRQRSYIIPFIAFILSLILAYLLSSVVWDVRIEADDGIDTNEIREMLSEVGVGVGSSLEDIDIERAENALLLECEDLAWVQINRRGTVLTVKTRGKMSGAPSTDILPFCSNIVAEKDGVIEEITVMRGVAAVRPGDTVRAGDILISGIVSNESGVHFVRAEGTVIAYTQDSVTASCLATEETESLSEGELCSVSVEILGKTINIFKNYGNLTDDCVIIEDEEVCTVGNDRRLPISLKREYIARRAVNTVIYSESELPTVAGERLSELLLILLRGADLVKLRTYGEYTNDGYKITAEYVKAENIGREVSVDLLG